MSRNRSVCVSRHTEDERALVSSPQDAVAKFDSVDLPQRFRSGSVANPLARRILLNENGFQSVVTSFAAHSV